MFRRLFALCLCLTQLSVFTALFAADNPYEQLAGTYTGEVYNGDDLDPVTTTFTLTPSGRLTGNYTVDEENGAYSGTLSNILFDSDRAISMEWTDQFGEGLAVMEFSSDFSSFTGEWSGKDGLNPLPWNGDKSAAH
jgi:hypothetical protein